MNKGKEIAILKDLLYIKQMEIFELHRKVIALKEAYVIAIRRNKNE